MRQFKEVSRAALLPEHVLQLAELSRIEANCLDIYIPIKIKSSVAAAPPFPKRATAALQGFGVSAFSLI